MGKFLMWVGFIAFLAGIFGTLFGKVPLIKLQGRLKYLGISIISIAVFVVGIVVNSFETTDPTEVTKVNASQQATTNDTNDKKEKDNIHKEATEHFKKYLFENFGGNGNEQFKVSWYDLIKDVQIRKAHDGKLYAVIYSTLYHDDEGKDAAQRLFEAVFAYTNNNIPYKIAWVDIKDQEGHHLISKDNPIDWYKN